MNPTLKLPAFGEIAPARLLALDDLFAAVASIRRLELQQSNPAQAGRPPPFRSTAAELCRRGKRKRNRLGNELNHAAPSRLNETDQPDRMASYRRRRRYRKQECPMNEEDGQQPPPNRSDKEEQAPKPSPSESVSLLKGNRPARILLCDDEPTVRDCMRLLFEWSFRDYELAQCDTGHGTLHEVARQNRCNRTQRAGKHMGLGLIIYLERGRINIKEQKPPANGQGVTD
jgi:hypothetical protein